jgi:hypothetical protein
MNGFIIAVCLVPYAGPVEDRVDVVEVNTVYCADNGTVVLEQIVLWASHPDTGDLRVVTWRWFRPPIEAPVYDHARGVWRLIWFDGLILRDVRGVTRKRSYTLYDPEVADREYLPKEQRRELSRP